MNQSEKQNTGKLIVVSGPSGVGKSTLCARLLKDDRVVRSVSATTRAPRDSEEHGVDYYFMEREEFEEKIEAGEFIEHAEIYGNLYGTPATPLREAVENGRYPVLDIDPQGAEALQKMDLEAAYVYLLPPDTQALRERLKNRGVNDEEEMETRLKAATHEMSQMYLYDEVLVNDDLDVAYRQLVQYLNDHVFPTGEGLTHE